MEIRSEARRISLGASSASILWASSSGRKGAVSAAGAMSADGEGVPWPRSFNSSKSIKISKKLLFSWLFEETSPFKNL